MTDPIPSELRQHFSQIAYVVDDLDDTEQMLMQLLGVPGFYRIEDITLAEGCTYRGQPSDCTLNLSIGYMGEVQIELIQPLRGLSIYAEFLEQNGPGLHHLGFWVPDFDSADERLRAAGVHSICEGRLESGTRFAYFDLQTAGASLIEIVGFDPNTRDFMRQLKHDLETGERKDQER